jgi:hypothetical protein
LLTIYERKIAYNFHFTSPNFAGHRQPEVAGLKPPGLEPVVIVEEFVGVGIDDAKWP